MTYMCPLCYCKSSTFDLMKDHLESGCYRWNSFVFLEREDELKMIEMQHENIPNLRILIHEVMRKDIQSFGEYQYIYEDMKKRWIGQNQRQYELTENEDESKMKSKLICNQCDRIFFDKSNLNRHLKKKVCDINTKSNDSYEKRVAKISKNIELGLINPEQIQNPIDKIVYGLMTRKKEFTMDWRDNCLYNPRHKMKIRINCIKDKVQNRLRGYDEFVEMSHLKENIAYMLLTNDAFERMWKLIMENPMNYNLYINWNHIDYVWVYMKEIEVDGVIMYDRMVSQPISNVFEKMIDVLNVILVCMTESYLMNENYNIANPKELIQFIKKEIQKRYRKLKDDSHESYKFFMYMKKILFEKKELIREKIRENINDAEILYGVCEVIDVLKLNSTQLDNEAVATTTTTTNVNTTPTVTTSAITTPIITSSIIITETESEI